MRRLDDWLHRWLWRTHWAFRRVLGGARRAAPPQPEPPEDLRAQPGFVELTAAYEAADRRANRLGSVHRSEQLMLLTVAIVAAVVGSSPAVWSSLKIYAVCAELLIGLGALALWARSARAERHETWAAARRLAEQLRVERVGWALGLGRFASGGGGTEQAVQDIRRRAGLAEGVFDADRVARWGDWAVAELIAGQAAYHEGLALGSGRISHRVHQLENLSAGAFILITAGFLGAYMVFRAEVGLHLKHWVEGVVIMTGAIAPAIGATCLALEATLSFREEAQRSKVLAGRLMEVAAALPPTPSLGDYRHALRTAAHLQISQEERWREASIRRRLFRGG